MNAPTPTPKLAHNVTRISHLDLPGAGQVYVQGNYAYVGHITNKEQLGTSILDVSDPRNPKLLSQIMLDDPDSHSHKARVVGDIMIVNSERNMTAIGRKADELPKLRKQLRDTLGRDPSHAELAQKLGVQESDIPAVEAQQKNPYRNGGFKIYDVKDRAPVIHEGRMLFKNMGCVNCHQMDSATPEVPPTNPSDMTVYSL